ncbi:hypothetical protein Drorol1_Dr00015086 [Drosera rotundifolia]
MASKQFASMFLLAAMVVFLFSSMKTADAAIDQVCYKDCMGQCTGLGGTDEHCRVQCTPNCRYGDGSCWWPFCKDSAGKVKPGLKKSPVNRKIKSPSGHN